MEAELAWGYLYFRVWVHTDTKVSRSSWLWENTGRSGGKDAGPRYEKAVGLQAQVFHELDILQFPPGSDNKVGFLLATRLFLPNKEFRNALRSGTDNDSSTQTAA